MTDILKQALFGKRTKETSENKFELCQHKYEEGLSLPNQEVKKANISKVNKFQN